MSAMAGHQLGFSSASLLANDAYVLKLDSGPLIPEYYDRNRFAVSVN
jgi:hypothetical protein